MVFTSRAAVQIGRRFPDAVEVRIAEGTFVQVPVRLPAAGSTTVGLVVRVPSDATPGAELRVQLAQRDAKSQRLLGGVRLVARMRNPDGRSCDEGRARTPARVAVALALALPLALAFRWRWCLWWGRCAPLVIAIRHADVDSGTGPDPVLNAAGQARAEELHTPSAMPGSRRSS